MTYSIYQDFDPLKVVVVGKSYPPEFYHWIQSPRLRQLFEKLAVETEEDFQSLISLLKKFNVEVLRPEIPTYDSIDGKFAPPPVSPRDHLGVIGTTLYQGYIYSNTLEFDFAQFYNNVRDHSWPECDTYDKFKFLPTYIQEECESVHHLSKYLKEFNNFYGSYSKIFSQVVENGTLIKLSPTHSLVGAMVNCVGKDRYFGTTSYDQDQQSLLHLINKEFPDTRNHIINTGGHLDGSYATVCPGLIFSLRELTDFNKTHPGWEVVYFDGRSPTNVPEYTELKLRNNGKWWIPGFENDHELTTLIETWLSHWTGFIDETVFDVNLLVVDQHNVIVNQMTDSVAKILDRYGITPHVINFRHKHFWDAGIHCITADLSRDGTMNDYFGN